MTTHSGGTHEVHLVTTSMGITKVPAHVQLSTRLKKSPAMFDLERYTSSAGLDSDGRYMYLNLMSVASSNVADCPTWSRNPEDDLPF